MAIDIVDFPQKNGDFIVIQWDFIVIQWDINGIYPLVNVYSLLFKMVLYSLVKFGIW